MSPVTRPESLDLNLLVALDALLDQRSVTRAAEQLHLSVPATSRALARIRSALGDEILVRAGREMVPTARGVALAPQVRALLGDVEALLTPGPAFDPGTLERTFTIRANDAVVTLLAGRLLARLAVEAPGVRLRLLPEGDEDLAPLRAGAIDLDVGALDYDASELVAETLATRDYVGVVRRTHPLAAQRVTARRLCAWPHIAFSRRGRAEGPLDDALAELGLRRKVVATVGTPLAGLLLVAGGDLVLPITGAVAAHHADDLGLHLFELPVQTAPIVLSQAWHPRSDADPAHRWLRELVSTILRETQA